MYNILNENGEPFVPAFKGESGYGFYTTIFPIEDKPELQEVAIVKPDDRDVQVGDMVISYYVPFPGNLPPSTRGNVGIVKEVIGQSNPTLPLISVMVEYRLSLAGDSGADGTNGVDGKGYKPIKTTKTNMQINTWTPVSEEIEFGSGVWTDGNRIYYSRGSVHLALDIETGLWEEKIWNGISSITDFTAGYIWTDGENVYYSRIGQQYVLDKETSTWVAKTWAGNATIFEGADVWSDGKDIYLSESHSSNLFVLDKDIGGFIHSTSTGIPGFTGRGVWTDGDNVYYSNPTLYGPNQDRTHYILNKDTKLWEEKVWGGLSESRQISGQGIWTDGYNVYHSRDGFGPNLILNNENKTWEVVSFTGQEFFGGMHVWTDGYKTYLSNENGTFVYNKSITVNAKPVLK